MNSGGPESLSGMSSFRETACLGLGALGAGSRGALGAGAFGDIGAPDFGVTFRGMPSKGSGSSILRLAGGGGIGGRAILLLSSGTLKSLIILSELKFFDKLLDWVWGVMKEWGCVGRESNPRHSLGKAAYYRYTTDA